MDFVCERWNESLRGYLAGFDTNESTTIYAKATIITSQPLIQKAKKNETVEIFNDKEKWKENNSYERENCINEKKKKSGL